MRSINTSLIALLPVAGLLFVGAGLLGVGTIKDLALVLFVGLAAGAYSSIFLATPIVCDLKEREPKYAALRQAGRRPPGRRGPRALPASAAEQRAARRGATAVKTAPPVAEVVEDDIVDAEPVEDEEAAPAAAAARTAGAARSGSSPRPGARPKRPQQRRGGGGRPSAKKRR